MRLMSLCLCLPTTTERTRRRRFPAPTLPFLCVWQCCDSMAPSDFFGRDKSFYSMLPLYKGVIHGSWKQEWKLLTHLCSAHMAAAAAAAHSAHILTFHTISLPSPLYLPLFSISLPSAFSLSSACLSPLPFYGNLGSHSFPPMSLSLKNPSQHAACGHSQCGLWYNVLQ